MCTPAISIGMQVVGAVVGAAGQSAQAQGQANMHAYQSQVAHNNAIVARNNQKIALDLAQDARVRGELEAQDFSGRVRQLAGQQRAVLAANGVQVGAGTAADIVQETHDVGQLDALTIRTNAAREALGFETRAMNFAAEAMNQNANSQLQNMAAQNAASAGNQRALSSLLTGAGSVASKWYSFNSAGVSVF